MTDEDRFKQLLIDAICGVGFPTLLLAQMCEQAGTARYDSLVQQWVWKRDVLVRVDIEKLQELYEGLCDAREENFKPTDPVDDYPGLIVTQ